MAQRVEAWGNLLEFPDDMSREEMSAIIRKNEASLNPSASMTTKAGAAISRGVDAGLSMLTPKPSIATRAEQQSASNAGLAAPQVPGVPVRRDFYNKMVAETPPVTSIDMLPFSQSTSQKRQPGQKAPPSGSDAWVKEHEDRRVPMGDFEELDKKFGGNFGKGNIDLNNRSVYVWPGNKGYSSLESMTVGIDGKETLIPTVSKDGKLMTHDEAINEFLKTGKHLGKFDTPEEASEYAIALERRQNAYYGNGPGKSILNEARQNGASGIVSRVRNAAAQDTQAQRGKQAVGKALVSGEPVEDIGLLGTLKEGAIGTARNIGATVDTLQGNAPNVISASKEAASAEKDPALESLLNDINARKKALGENPGWMDSIKAVGGAAMNNPKGAGMLLAEQFPNSAAALAAGGAGAAAGSLFGPAGMVVGGIAGLFGANTALETGSKALEAASDGSFPTVEQNRILREGAIKGGVITGIDAATLGLTNFIMGTTARAVERATVKTLMDKGIDVTNKAAVLAATKNPAIVASVKSAQDLAQKASTTLGHRVARVGGAAGLETLAESAGEYVGEMAATGKPDKVEAIIEGLSSLGQSAGEIAFTAARNKARLATVLGKPVEELSDSTLKYTAQRGSERAKAAAQTELDRRATQGVDPAVANAPESPTEAAERIISTGRDRAQEIKENAAASPDAIQSGVFDEEPDHVGDANKMVEGTGGAVTDNPTPEPVDTLNAQMNALAAGNKPGMLLTPGEPMPDALPPGVRFAEIPGRGTLLYRDDATLQAALDNRMGEALGYGIDEKPGDATHVVTARDQNGTVIQDVVTDGRPEVQKAATAVAGPGGSVQVRPVEEAMAERSANAPLSQAQKNELHKLRAAMVKNKRVMEAYRKETGKFDFPALQREVMSGKADHLISLHNETQATDQKERNLAYQKRHGFGTQPRKEIDASKEADEKAREQRNAERFEAREKEIEELSKQAEAKQKEAQKRTQSSPKMINGMPASGTIETSDPSIYGSELLGWEGRRYEDFHSTFETMKRREETRPAPSPSVEDKPPVAQFPAGNENREAPAVHPMRPLIESLIKRRSAAKQGGKDLSNSIDRAKEVMDGKRTNTKAEHNYFRIKAAEMKKVDEKSADILRQIAEAVNEKPLVIKQPKGYDDKHEKGNTSAPTGKGTIPMRGSDPRFFRKKESDRIASVRQRLKAAELKAKQATHRGGLSVSSVQSTVSAIKSGWKNAPEIIVADDMNDPAIPESVRVENDKQSSRGDVGQPEGFLYQGKVYVVASEMNSTKDIIRVLSHESFGHFGLRGLFREELKPILKQVAALRRKDVEKKAKQYGLNMESEQDRLIAAEEVLAEMAQRNPQISFVRQAIAAIRAWFRKHIPGFDSMKLTDDEIIQQYLIPARDFVKNGQGGSAKGGIVFRRVWHGTPTIWQTEPGFPHGRPRLDKVGTEGSGSQSFGWGFYIAGDRSLAKIYRDMLSKRNTDKSLGSLYTLDIPDSSLPYLLDWDKKMNDQSKQVQNILRKEDPGYINDMMGEDWYNKLKGSDKAASKYLASIGIVGNKYLDSGSRSKGEGSFNYVIWDQKTLDKIAMLERNGEVLDAMREAAFSRQSQTDTQAFKKWFDGSKVVDEDGGPLRVFHGTVSDFSKFDDKALGSATGAKSAALGFFFTDNPRVAESYAHYSATDAPVKRLLKEADQAEKNGDWDAYDTKIEEAEKLEALFMDSQNRHRGQNVVPVYLSLKNPLVIDAKGETYVSIETDITKQIRAAKRSGRDGVIIHNLDDAAGLSDAVANHYIVFDPTQIKSATGNNGEFDSDNADIRFSRTADIITLYHTSPVPIKKINGSGRFGSFLFFGSSPSHDSVSPQATTYKMEINNNDIIDAKSLFYQENSGDLAPLVEEVAERFDVDEDTAEDLISEKTSLMDLDKHDPEDDFDMQLYTAKAAKLLGYKGVMVRDEHGTSYMIDMEGREGDLKKPGDDPDEIRFSRSGNNASWNAPEPRREISKAADRAFKENAAKNKRFREEHITLWDKSRKWLRRQLSPGGLLPQRVFAEKISRDNEFSAIEFDVAHLVGKLEKAIKADFGQRAINLDEKTQQLLSDVLAGNIDKNVPENTKTALIGMRQYIDSLSMRYVNSLREQAIEQVAMATLTDNKELMTKAEDNARLQVTIMSNLGEYVHRSYRAFDDPDWAKKIPDQVINNARQYLIERNLESMGKAEAERKAEIILNEIVKHGTAYDNMAAFIAESKLGAKDLSVLKTRKQIAPEIRALLGEYKDPRIGFAKSATKMGRLIFNQKFLENIRKDGFGKFLFTDETKPPEATAKIAADSSEVLAPLNGLWVTPEVDQAFKDALGKEHMEDWYRKIVQINGMVKYGKTVLSPTTAARNWMSAFFFAVANGHFDMRHMAKSVNGLREYFTHGGDEKKMAYLRELKQLGVVYDTPYAGEMMRLLADTNVADTLILGKRKLNIKGAFDMATKFYQYGDDFWKIIGFENEKRMWMNTGMSEQEAKVKAAERIRNTYPTYSMIGKGIQALRRFPLAGTFVSFPAEIVRTSANMLKYLSEDYKNPKTRSMAVRRGIGLAITSAFAFAAQALSMAMLGFDDDDDEAVRKMAAPWQRNSNLLYTGRDTNGNIRYMDMSFLDPYNYWKRPIIAVLRNQPADDSLKDIIKETLTPFFGTDILAGAIFEVMANKKETGAPVFKSHDDPVSQVVDIANHIRKTVQPGIFNNMERTYKALNGEVSRSGKKYDAKDEAAAWFGFRMSTLDPKVSLFYRSFDFKDAKSDAEKKLRDVVLNPNDIGASALRDTFDESMKIRTEAFGNMSKLVNAAMRSGMTRQQVVSTLRNGGVSIQDTMTIINGKEPKWRMPETAASQASKARSALGPEAGERVMGRYRELSGIAAEQH